MSDEDGVAILCDECGEQVGDDAIEVYDGDGATVWVCAGCFFAQHDACEEVNNEIPF